LKKNSEKYQALRKGIRKILSIIMGLLKDRVKCSDDEPDRKKAKVEGYRLKK
jgi:hypothetical protein